MPRVVLKGPLTYQYRSSPRAPVTRLFRRGVIEEVDERLYHSLLRGGHFADPDHHVEWSRPSHLKAIRRQRGKLEVPIVRDLGLGDVLMVTIPLREFALENPQLEIIYGVHTKFVPVVKGLEFCKRVCAITDIRGSYQFGIDLRGYVERQSNHTRIDRIDLFSHYLIGRKPSSYQYPIKVPPAWRAQGRAVLGINGEERPVLLLATRASMLNRSWGVAYNREFCELAIDNGWRVVLTDQPRKNDPEILDHPQVLDLRGKLSVEELAWATSAATVVVSPDTGTTHLAEALGTKCVTYFTTVPPGLRVGHYRWTRVVYPEGQLSCLGCIHTPRCSEPDGNGGRRPHRDPKPCADLSTPAMVWEQVVFTQHHDPPWDVYSWRDPTPARPPSRPVSSEVRFDLPRSNELTLVRSNISGP